MRVYNHYNFKLLNNCGLCGLVFKIFCFLSGKPGSIPSMIVILQRDVFVCCLVRYNFTLWPSDYSAYLVNRLFLVQFCEVSWVIFTFIILTYIWPYQQLASFFNNIIKNYAFIIITTLRY